MVEAQFSAKLHSQVINCKRVQFLLTLAWEYTVHKVQGLTLGQGEVCLKLYKQNRFNAAQVYTGLSRATSFSFLSIICEMYSDYIKTQPSVLAEYDRLRKESTSF